MGNRQTTWRTLLDSLLFGESQTFDRMLGANAFTPYTISASGQVMTGPCLIAGGKCLQGSGATLLLANGTNVNSSPLVHRPASAGHMVGDTFAIVQGGDAYCSGGLYASVNSGAQFVVFGHSVVNSGA